MASMIATMFPPPLFGSGMRHPSKNLHNKFTVSAIGVPFMYVAETQRRVAVIAKATGESSDSSSLSIVKSVKNVWDKSEDRVALIGLGFASIVALWASANLITAIDKLPLIPSVFEFVGILFSSWFIYRYLLFKPDRDELFQTVNRSISDILGQ